MGIIIQRCGAFTKVGTPNISDLVDATVSSAGGATEPLVPSAPDRPLPAAGSKEGECICH